MVLHVNAACSSYILCWVFLLHSMLNDHALCPEYMLHVHAVCSCPCFMFMLHVHAVHVCPCCMSLFHVFVYSTCPYLLSMLHSRASCPCCMSLKWKRKISSEVKRNIGRKRSEITSASFCFEAVRKIGSEMKRRIRKIQFVSLKQAKRITFRVVSLRCEKKLKRNRCTVNAAHFKYVIKPNCPKTEKLSILLTFWSFLCGVCLESE